ncbi:MAG: hypothetical protein KDD60_05270 [Bdellovibrionales bacterium]|nr:hypothetical protein [Bdellovibrionales bacterium]
MSPPVPHVVVRQSRPSDIDYVERIAELLIEASRDHDVAVRERALLEEKICDGHAAIILEQQKLVGFGYISVWSGNVISHSGVVIDPAFRGRGLFRLIKKVLIEIGLQLHPSADVISLSSSALVAKVNRSLGFHDVPLEQLCSDLEFWKGCFGCRQYHQAQISQHANRKNQFGTYCCCSGMRLFRQTS